MKNAILITITTMGLTLGAYAKCPSVLVKKKLSHKTAYNPETMEKISGKSLTLLNSVGCNPSIKKMSKVDQRKLIDAEYQRKLEAI